MKHFVFYKFSSFFASKPSDKKIVTVTVHRRESIGINLKNVCTAIKFTAQSNSDIFFIVQVHPNPKVKNVLEAELANTKNIKLIDPQAYHIFISILLQSDLILTDSGGIQEEISILAKPALILRTTTERPEALSDYGQLIGYNPDTIIKAIEKKLNNSNSLKPSSFYGANVSEQIISVLDA